MPRMQCPQCHATVSERDAVCAECDSPLQETANAPQADRSPSRIGAIVGKIVIGVFALGLVARGVKSCVRMKQQEEISRSLKEHQRENLKSRAREIIRRRMLNRSKSKSKTVPHDQ